MLPESTRHFGDQNAAQQRFLSLFLRSERESFWYGAALLANVSDAEDIVQQTALALWERFDAYDPSQPFRRYVNGQPVVENPLKVSPPFRVEAAELGNWNASGFPDNDPSLIRNFSGALDEFCLFSRALYSRGKPQSDPATPTRNQNHHHFTAVTTVNQPFHENKTIDPCVRFRAVRAALSGAN
jgi:hypothetical protein